MDSDKTKEMYRQMVRIREFEESLIPLINDGTIKTPVHLCIGQEATAVGVCSALRKQDHVYGNHRSHGHYLAKGGSMKRLCAEIYGKKTGCSHGRGGSMHIIDPDVGFMGSVPIVAGTVSLAVGDAMTTKLRKEDRVTVVFFGDGAIGEGVIYEAINLAVLYDLPILFVCENNGYSTHMPLKKTIKDGLIFERFRTGWDIESRCENGNNVEEIRDLTEFLLGLRLPAFLELKTYRLCGHVGPDDKILGKHTDIRPKDEVEYWKTQDPIKNTFDISDDERLKILIEIKLAHQFAEESPWPEHLEKYVYA